MKKQPLTHGGPRPGSGRKPKPEGERLGNVFSIRLTDDDKRLLDETDAREWARDVLIGAAKRRQKR